MLVLNQEQENSVGPDETAHYEPSLLDLLFSQKNSALAVGSKWLIFTTVWYSYIMQFEIVGNVM